MRGFEYHTVGSIDEIASLAREESGPAGKNASTQFLAGGTTIIDLMKLDVLQPSRLIDINQLGKRYSFIEASETGLALGALCRMADVASHPMVRRTYPVIADTLRQAASPQIRNMATLGGNVLQRTRCNYFRDVSYEQCNKRKPGSGCAALEGVNRKHAVLGVSDACIASYPGDFAQALVALDAQVEITGRGGSRRIPFETLHRLPGETPHVETSLEPDDLITTFFIPAGNWTRRSRYLKIRDRKSYEFALASAAVALNLQDGKVQEARIALGGVATKPWRAREAESVLNGRVLDEESAHEAAKLAFVEARTRAGNDYKVELGRRTLVRALLEAASMEV